MIKPNKWTYDVLHKKHKITITIYRIGTRKYNGEYIIRQEDGKSISNGERGITLKVSADKYYRSKKSISEDLEKDAPEHIDTNFQNIKANY